MKSPFKFLDSYTIDDRDIFFGRDREIEELYQRVFDSKLLLVYGVSGTGKSSLIHCGLANKFLETDWLPLVIRRGGNIIESMAAAVGSATLTRQQNKFASPVDFKKGVRSLYLDHYKPVFFIFDQFEELFIFGDKEERKKFISIVKSLTESDLQCRMIFVMREEYMAGITEFEKYIPTIFSNRVRIEKMSHRNALEAINEPCKVFNITLEEGFAESLLEKLSPGETDVELTYLQVFLDKIYRLAVGFIPPLQGGQRGSSPLQESQGGPAQKAGGSPPTPESHGGSPTPTLTLNFTFSLLEKTGNVSDLLGSFLDDQIALLEDPETGLVILKSFVSVKGTKQPMTSGEAREYVMTLGRDLKEPMIKEMIQVFVNLRILCDKDQNSKYELRHDALAAKIYEKFTIAEKELLEVRKYVENAYYTFEKRGIFLNRQDLEYLNNYENKLILPQNLKDFVIQSKDKLLKQKHALKRITRITILIFILILAITLRFYISTQQGKDVNARFESAVLLSATDPIQGLKAELDLWKQDSTSKQLYSMIIRDFQRIISLNIDSADPLFKLQDSFKPVILESPVINACISKDGKYIYGWMQNQSVFIYELASSKIKTFKTNRDINHLELSEKDSALALIYTDNKGSVCDLNGEKVYDFITTMNDIKNDELVCFFPSGSNQLAVARDNYIEIYDKKGYQVYNLENHSGNVNSLDISPDGRFIVSVSDDKRGIIWNFNQELNSFTVYDSLKGHKDRIWSCRFNKTGKYIITASADSTIKIWDLNGTQINPRLYFALQMWSKYRLNNGEQDEDRGNPEYSKYYGKFCDALFSPGEMEIIATGYENVDSPNTHKISFYKALFYDHVRGFTNAFSRTYFAGSIEEVQYKHLNLTDLLISPDEKVAAVVSNSSSQVLLLAGTYVLTTFPGGNPLFSNNGKELYWCSGEKIFKAPIHPQEISRLIESVISSQRPGESSFVDI
jgi:WD40 repeat protein